MKKKLLVGVMLLGVPCGFVAGLLSSEAEASRGWVCMTTYYSDETYQTAVGWRGCGCISPCKTTGVVTPYAEDECTPC